MYKPSLLRALYDDYEDAAKKYMDARNTNAREAEMFLHRLKLLGCAIEYTQMMIDGTMGKEPLHRDHEAGGHAARA